MSVLIDAQVWASKAPLIPLLNLLQLSELPNEQHAVQTQLNDCTEAKFPPTPSFSASELLEALFLEGAKPVVAFDAPDPELIALRLLTALWPDIRRHFSISTFALSPRKIGGRDFDLVFAPVSAKAKFSDWPGRRVDGRSLQNNRHRWTGAIVQRVFEDPLPRLLSEREINLLGGRDANSAAALRIALLWDELLDKLQYVPTAALGLLDIANSGMVSNTEAVKSLEPLLAEAVNRAASTLTDRDAWDFVGALTRKMFGQSMPAGSAAAGELVEKLAERTPLGAISFLRQTDSKGAIVPLIPSIAAGLAKGANPVVERALLDAPGDIFTRLVVQSGALSRRVVDDDALIERMGRILSSDDQELVDSVGKMVLPYLIDDRQLAVAKPIFNRMGSLELVAELSRLEEANGFKARSLSSIIIERAREAGCLPAVRDALILSGASAHRDSLIAHSIEPNRADVDWLLSEKRLTKNVFSKLLVGVLEQANEEQFAEICSDSKTSERILKLLPKNSIEILVRIANQDSLPINTHVHVVDFLISKVSDSQKLDIAHRSMERCLRSRFDGDETKFLLMLLDIISAKVNGRWIASAGLGKEVAPDVVSRNLTVFNMAPLPVRDRLVKAVDDIALALQSRYEIDISEVAASACAKIMSDAGRRSQQTLLAVAGMLMPSLLRAKNYPVSSIIVVLFPPLYRELAGSSDVPEFLKFVPFFDWDRCKTARRELVDAFMSSSWKPGDLALIAYACNDVFKIIEHVSYSYKGDHYLSKIESDLGGLTLNGEQKVARIIAEVRSKK